MITMIRFVVFAMLLCAPVSSFAKTLDNIGKTYPFAEKDALSEIEEKARRVDWKKQMASLKEKMVNFRPAVPSLPKVIEDRLRQVDMTYTLNVDVPDPRDPSQILYPKGFSFNPLSYMTLPGCVVFVDPGDRQQLAWLKKSSFAKESMARILLTGGNVGRVEQTLGRPVFFADSILVERFQIMAVPSVACQKGVSLEIHEIDLQ